MYKDDASLSFTGALPAQMTGAVWMNVHMSHGVDSAATSREFTKYGIDTTLCKYR